jgi:DNA repair protein RadC
MIKYKSNISQVRLVRDRDIPKYKLKSSRDAYDFIRNHIDNDNMTTSEEFWTIYLNNANNLVGIAKMSEGGITGTVVDVRKVMATGLLLMATQIILCHNHPSTNLTPSIEDKSITRKIQEAGEVLDVKVIDHVIISIDNEKYYSFADDGIL